MRKIKTAILMAVILALSGCATSAKQAVVDNPEKTSVEAVVEIPEKASGETAVFGKIRLVESVNNLSLPTSDQDGALYLVPGGTDGPDKKLIKVKCASTGEFGVYLPTGSYRLVAIDVQGYELEPVMTLVVPEGRDAVYAGTIVVDGVPTGVETGTDDSMFVVSVKDEFEEFGAGMRDASPKSIELIGKSLITADDAIATGDYPRKVFRSKDVARTLTAKTRAFEEVVEGGLVSLSYIINPALFITSY